MDNKKIEVEFSVKDNLTKKLKSMSDEVKNMAKEIQSSIKQIENSFSNINIKTNMSSKVKSINDQIKNIGKDIKDVEVDIKANVDTSGLGANSLGNILSATTMLGASETMNRLGDSVNEVSSLIKGNFNQALNVGIKDTLSYQTHLNRLLNVFEEFTDVYTTNNPLSRNILHDVNLGKEISELTVYFDELRDSVDGAGLASKSLSKISDAIKNMTVDAENNKLIIPIDMDSIKDDLDKVIEMSQPTKGVKIPIELENLAEVKSKIAEIKSQISANDIKIGMNTDFISTSEKAIDNILNKMDELGDGAELDNLINKFSKINTAINDTKLEIDQLNASNVKLKTSLNELNQKFSYLKKEITNTLSPIGKFKSTFENMQRTLNGTATTFTGKLMNGLQVLNNKLKATTTNTDKLKKSMSGLKGILAKLGLALGVAQLINLGKSAIQTASSLQEVQNVINVVFGNSSEEINKWSKEVAGAFGLTELQAKKFSGTFGSIFKASGVDTSFIDDMSMKLSQLAGDMASFHDISQQDAFEKLRAGIVGSVEPLQSLGYNLNASTMEAYALSRGINVSWNELSEADKQILRYNYLLQVTSGVQGDFARTSGSFANQVRGLSNAFSQLKSEVGIALMAALTPIIQVISTIISWLTALMRVFNNFLRSIGLIKGVASEVSSAVGGVVGGITDMAGSVGDVADAIGGVGDSAGAAGEKVAELAKEMKGLMGIDELNALPEADKGSGSGSGGSGGSGGVGGSGGAGGVGDIGGLVAPDNADDYTNKFEDMIEKMRQQIEQYLGTINFEPLITSFKGLLASIKPILDTIGEVIKWFITEILEPLGRFTIERALPEFFDTLSAVFTILSPILDSFVSIFKMFWDNVLQPIVSWTADKFVDAWDAINKGLKAFGDWLNGDGNLLADILTSIAIAIGIVTGAFALANGVIALWNAVCAIASVVTGAFGAVLAFVTSPIGLIIIAITALIAIIIVCCKHWDEIKEAGAKAWEWIKEKASDCWQWIKDAFGALADWFKTTVVEPIKNFFTEAWNKISELASNCWSAICNAWQSAKDWFNNNVLTPIKNFFTTTWDNIKTSVSNTWTNICNVWKIASSWFSNNVLTPIKNVFTTVWDNIKQIPKNAWTAITGVYQGAKTWFSNIFEGVKSAITSKFDAVKTKVSSVFENVKSTVSNAIEKIKGFFKFDWSLPHIKLPHFSISGSANPLKWITEGVPKISVSWYADGGIMTKPSLFGINGNSLMIGGEAGAEAIVPLDLLWNNMDKFAEKIVAGIINSQSQDINLKVDLDGKQVASSVIKNINRQTKLNGRSPLK